MSHDLMSVSTLNTQIKSLLEATFIHVLVEGEVASCTYHTSGHLYFTLKDTQSSIKCVMWRSSVAKMKFQIEKGMHIVIEGSLGVYTPRGEYQFYAVHIEPYGQGALALAYEQLKEKLKKKGYFETARKKPIPKQIRTLALVTAKQSAALHDMLKVIEKRWALVTVTIVDTLVQGSHASQQIAKSLAYADSLGVDLIVVGRGGGSTEDLWAFNEEVVADRLFEMKTPVVSAVGHEVDVMMSDLVADLRAPTPSAAIEMILPDSQEVRYTLAEMAHRYEQTIAQRLQQAEERLTHLSQRLKVLSPTRRLNALSERFDGLGRELGRVMRQRLQHQEGRVIPLKKQLSDQIGFIVEQKSQAVGYHLTRLKSQDPLLKCRSGWAELSQEGKVVPLSTLQEGERFYLEDGELKLEAQVLKRVVHTTG